MLKKYNLQEYIDRPIEFTDMQKMLTPYFKNSKLKLITKVDLTKFSPEEIFNDEYAPFVVYYAENKDSDVGHFMLLTLRSKIEMEFFNPAGNSRENMEKYHTELLDFYVKYDLSLTFNKYPLQTRESNTCSRHCVFRAMLFNIELDDFFNFFPSRNILTPDEFVSCLIRYPKFSFL